MLVVNKTEFPVALMYEGKQIIIPSDGRVHPLPDVFYNQYNDILHCVQSPIVKYIPVEPPKPPVITKIPSKEKQSFVFTAGGEMGSKARSNRGKKRTWDIWKNKRENNELKVNNVKIEENKEQIEQIEDTGNINGND